jgi:hypothetical protein
MYNTIFKMGLFGEKSRKSNSLRHCTYRYVEFGHMPRAEF